MNKCEHHKRSVIGYIEWHDWAYAMVKAGYAQMKCPYCHLYFFEEEMNDQNIKFPEPKTVRRDEN